MLSNSIGYMRSARPSHGNHSRAGATQPEVVRGCNSTAECLVHIEEVAGSTPATPTTFLPLSRGLYAIIDREDAWRVSAYSWSANAVSPGRYYAQTKIAGKNLYLHRFIINAAQNQLVDHVNGDRLDCRRSNLRLATPSQNSANSKHRPGSSGYRGVYAIYGRFRAKIRIGNRQKTLGYFHTAEEAARAYDRAAIQLHGEFAVLNFPGMTYE